MNKQNILLITLLSFATVLLGVLLKEALKVDELVLNSLAEQFSREQIDKMLPFQNKLQRINYFFIPLMLLIKVSIIAAVLDAGCFFFDKEIKYKKLFNIVVRAEFIFLLVIVFKTAWFYFFRQSYTLEELQYFYPLSVLSITGYEGLQPWYIYPMQVFNLFEAAYWLILAWHIAKELKITTGKALTIVAGSYGVALLVWIAGVMFFTLNIS